ncbi:TetR/AcrR family transcriptional regulator [Streptomyces murinus]|uniref:TetR/AcrR family transcriptional regulator n=1 Tax=Streptomyces murinus TaxID=33900 RepID=UPI0038260C83
MTSGNASPGFHPPQQARSRAALQRILVAAERELATAGAEEFTMAAVADRAGLSVGAIYRRFENKEQLLGAIKDRLLNQVEQSIVAALEAVDGGLSEVVDAFTRALADSFSAGAHVLPQVAGNRRAAGSPERSRKALANIEQIFLNATIVHAKEIRRAEPVTALVIAFRTITASCVHRVLTSHVWPDGISWSHWSRQVADMATAYLTSPDSSGRTA